MTSGNNSIKSIGFFIIHCLLFSCIATLTKYLMQYSISIFQILVIQTFFACLILFLFDRNIFKPFPKREQLFAYFIRALFWIGGTVLFFMSLQLVELSMAIALSFSTPLFTTILAIVILKETPHKDCMIALIFGFIGVLIVLKPAFLDFAPQHLMVILACMLWSVTDIMIKIMGKDNKNSTITWFYFFFSFLFLIIFIIILKLLGEFYSPSISLVIILDLSIAHIVILILISIFFIGNIMLLTHSYKIADLTRIQPFSFTSIIFVSILSYIVFGEIITISTIIGSIVIIASTSFIAYNAKF